MRFSNYVIRLVSSLALIAALTSCDASQPSRHNSQPPATSNFPSPSQMTIKSAISYLTKNFEVKHPALVNWNDQEVKHQLDQSIPVGTALDIGWLIIWPTFTPGELSRVLIPWHLLGQSTQPQPSSSGRQPPKGSITLGYTFTGGSIPSDAVTTALKHVITVSEMQSDSDFAAVTNIRQSIHYPQWIIFSTVPYLPVTDSAYGFATLINGNWEVVDFGTAKVGCNRVPASVEEEFGFSC